MSRFSFILLLVGLFIFGGCQKGEQQAPPPAEEQQQQEQMDTTSVDTSGMQSMEEGEDAGGY